VIGSIACIARREARSFFIAPLGFLVTIAYVFLAELFFFGFLENFNQQLVEQSNIASAGAAPAARALSLNGLVIEGYFQLLLSVLVFFVPLITMRAWAGDRKDGMLEMYGSSPLGSGSLIWGKFAGVSAFALWLVALGSVPPWLLFLVGRPDPWPMLCGSLGAALCALAFVSLGLAVSAAAGNQIVAAAVSIVVLLLLCLLEVPAGAAGGLPWLSYLSPVGHAREMIAGVISGQALVYFVSLIVFGFALTRLFLEWDRV
jgi:ABC-2 type transport system permease protein